MVFRIEELLQEKGITKAAFADLMGTSKQNVNSLIKGNPTKQKIVDMADALGVPVWQLFASPDEVKADLSVGSSPVLTCPVCGAPLHLTAEPMNGK